MAACGEVRLGFSVPDLQRVAIKIICKRVTTLNSSDSSYNVLNKVRILQLVNHLCNTSLEDMIDTPNFLFIVLELAEGGELFDKIIEKTRPLLPNCLGNQVPTLQEDLSQGPEA